MRNISILYPHATPTVLYSEGDFAVEFGMEATLPQSIPIQTGDYEGTVALRDETGRSVAHCPNLIHLEPPEVQPYAYTAEYECQFRRVFQFIDYGDLGPLRHTFRYRIPPLWPALPEKPSVGPWSDRIDGVVAVCSNKYLQRRKDLDAIALWCRQNKLEFAVYGQVPFDEVWYRGPCDNKLATMQRYRYAYCAENSEHPNYCTEKLPEALAAGCVPFYRGAKRDRYPWMFSLDMNTLGHFQPSVLEVDVYRKALIPWYEARNYEVMRADMSFDHIARMLMHSFG